MNPHEFHAFNESVFLRCLARDVLVARAEAGQEPDDPDDVTEKVERIGADHLSHGWTRQAVEVWAFRFHGPDFRPPCEHFGPGTCARCGAVLRQVWLTANGAGVYASADGPTGPWFWLRGCLRDRLRGSPDLLVPHSSRCANTTGFISTSLWRRLFPAQPLGEVPLADGEADDLADAALAAYKAVRGLRKPLQLEALDIARRIAKEVNR